MRSIIRLLKKQNKGGFTLVEVVVSVALLAILMGGMMMFIAPIVRNFNDNQKDQSAQSVAACITIILFTVFAMRPRSLCFPTRTMLR